MRAAGIHALDLGADFLRRQHALGQQQVAHGEAAQAQRRQGLVRRVVVGLIGMVVMIVVMVVVVMMRAGRLALDAIEALRAQPRFLRQQRGLSGARVKGHIGRGAASLNGLGEGDGEGVGGGVGAEGGV